ncbi:TIGR03757 family integrating conjugative element protein [Pectobacterium sp. CHL-2024]|uniref:TIGR03757 family integrating conjugative element protein n=1 Tax=Pectobacterium TaxID=122277 RepID=UPI001F104978|nr:MULTISPECIES: TIGR03757 family integrating conjugative element protein [Pectobacterium]MCH5052222.1 TIGR03757 family integrating conjugative element protein [Pectobacterium aquaticum]GKW07634.1 integrating conjugative element protein [Pectobacterium carotovorum subsp. carotovorum]
MNGKIYAFLLLFLPVPLFANPVVYTDQQHPPTNLTPETQIVWLDAPERLQRSVFGEFPASMEQATAQAQAVMRSPQWQQHENDLQTAYRGVVHAWEIGVRKYPAVVFDDRDVVYGTADVAMALAYKMQERGRP